MARAPRTDWPVLRLLSASYRRASSPAGSGISGLLSASYRRASSPAGPGFPGSSARRTDAHRLPTRLFPVTVEPPPEHVLATFGLTGVQPAPLGASWEGGWLRRSRVVDGGRERSRGV